jgi:hypothetical protein
MSSIPYDFYSSAYSVGPITKKHVYSRGKQIYGHPLVSEKPLHQALDIDTVEVVGEAHAELFDMGDPAERAKYNLVRNAAMNGGATITSIHRMFDEKNFKIAIWVEWFDLFVRDARSPGGKNDAAGF